MRETIRIPWVTALQLLIFQMLALIGLGGIQGSPGVIRPWLYGALAAAWALLTWRTATARLQVSPEGIRSHGTWRTRFVSWDDLVRVRAFPATGPLWEFPIAILSDGNYVPLTGAYGLRSERESRVAQIAEHLTMLAEQA
ncbi:PH domain-containing protein [Streptomyces hokutonensis]|uniref:PH domain-containing protein n=1 Tax=Streptomyces hokutonensis TaxID=1306990 RepID=UPI0036CA2E15